MCADGQTRCPRFEFALITDEEYAAFETLSRPGVWHTGFAGVTGLNQRDALSDIAILLPDVSPACLRSLLKSGEFGRLEAQSSLKDHE